MKLNKEEKDIIKAFENGKLKSVPGFKDEKTRYERATRYTLDGDMRETIIDFVKIKGEGVPIGQRLEALKRRTKSRP